MLNLGFNEITDAILVHLKGDIVFICVFHVVGILTARSVSAVALGRPTVTCWNKWWLVTDGIGWFTKLLCRDFVCLKSARG